MEKRKASQNLKTYANLLIYIGGPIAGLVGMLGFALDIPLLCICGAFVPLLIGIIMLAISQLMDRSLKNDL